MINTPFNYTGSKFKILEQILPLFDYDKDYFIDLFCGGGSVYSNVVSRYKRVLINDIITDLVLIHKNLIHNPDEFISRVKEVIVKSKDDVDYYLELRSDYNKNKSPEKLWALMLSCTNNMMRFNKKFEFNQTFGKRTWNDSTENKVNTFVNFIHNYKDKIKFESKHFFEIIPQKPTMVYLDPPYINTEAGYNAYWSSSFEKRLYEYILELNNNGHSFMLSGVKGKHKKDEESALINSLINYGFNYRIIDLDYEKVARKKNSKESQEIVIFNYEVISENQIVPKRVEKSNAPISLF